MNIRQIDYQQYKEEINRFSLPSASAEYVEFSKNFWQAKPIFIGVFNEDELKAVLPLFERLENGIIAIEAAIKTYTEIISLDSNFCYSLDLIIDYVKKNFKFDVLNLSLCSIIKAKPDFKSGSASTFAYAVGIKERDPERVLMEIVTKKSRNQIRLACKKGLAKELGGDIEKFYHLYQSSMQRLGAVPKEKKYFYDLKSAFGNNFYILLALKDGKFVGANLWVVKNQYLSLMFNASDKEYWNLSVNNFLYWEMILWGLKNSIIWFDYGINAARDKEQIHFKESFGARAHPINHIVKYNSIRAYARALKIKFKFLIKIMLNYF